VIKMIPGQSVYQVTIILVFHLPGNGSPGIDHADRAFLLHHLSAPSKWPAGRKFSGQGSPSLALKDTPDKEKNRGPEGPI
jgi:hypothetical protein